MPLSENAPSGVIRDRFARVRREERREWQKQQSRRRAYEDSLIRRSYRHEVKEQDKLLKKAIATEKEFNKRRREQSARRNDHLNMRHCKQVDLDQFFRRVPPPTPPPRVDIDLTKDDEPAPEEEFDFDFEPAPVAPTPVFEPQPEPPVPTIVHQEEPVPAPVQRCAPIDSGTLQRAVIVGAAAVYVCGFVSGAWTMWI